MRGYLLHKSPSEQWSSIAYSDDDQVDKINSRVDAGSVFIVIEQPFANNKNDEEDRDD